MHTQNKKKHSTDCRRGLELAWRGCLFCYKPSTKALTSEYHKNPRTKRSVARFTWVNCLIHPTLFHLLVDSLGSTRKSQHCHLQPLQSCQSLQMHVSMNVLQCGICRPLKLATRNPLCEASMLMLFIIPNTSFEVYSSIK